MKLRVKKEQKEEKIKEVGGEVRRGGGKRKKEDVK